MTNPSPLRLNVFALPHQTAIWFWLIAGVLWFAAGVGGLSGEPLYLSWLTIGFIIIPLRGILAYPERQLRRKGFILASPGEYPQLHQAIANQSHLLGLVRTPQLVLIAPPPTSWFHTLRQRLQRFVPAEVPTSLYDTSTHVFGSWRRWYIAIPYTHADHLEGLLLHPEEADLAEAQLLHELHHFKTGDYWQMEYLQQLFQFNVKFVGWLLVFMIGLTFLLWVAAADVQRWSPSDLLQTLEPLAPDLVPPLRTVLPSEASWAEVQTQSKTFNFGLGLTFAMNALFPFIVINGVLLWLFWPRFWRAREFYADAGVLHTQKAIRPFLFGLFGIQKSILQKLPLPLVFQSLGKLYPPPLRFWQRLPLRQSFHPDRTVRLRALVEPTTIFDGWRTTAIVTGTLALLIEVMFTSPLTLPTVSDVPIFFPVLMLYAVLALALVPIVVTQGDAGAELRKMVWIVVGLRLGWLAINLLFLFVLLLVNPTELDQILRIAVAGYARYFGFGADLGLGDLGQFLVDGTLSNVIMSGISAAILFGSLTMFHTLLKRMLAWYRFPGGADGFTRAVRGLVLLIGILWVGILLPVASFLTGGELILLSPAFLLWVVIAVTILTIGFFVYLRFTRSRTGCANCDAEGPPVYCFGTLCEQCGEFLHPWLIAAYDS